MIAVSLFGFEVLRCGGVKDRCVIHEIEHSSGEENAISFRSGLAVSAVFTPDYYNYGLRLYRISTSANVLSVVH